MLNFDTPYFGNIIGRLLVWVYSGTFKHFFTFPPVENKAAPVYRVKRIFPFWMKIIGQTHGEIIFIHDTYWNTEKGLRTVPHEFIHVWQARSHGWWGLWFMMKYVWYLLYYGYQNNPFEVEAREKSGF